MELIEQEPKTGILAPSHAFVPLRTAAVLGAGTMGAQIAGHLANAGMQVQLLDVPAEDASTRNAVVERGFERAIEIRPDPFFSSEAKARITIGNFEDHFDRISDVEWIVEAVVERLEVKRSLLERVESVAREDAIISTNTSGLSISAIAEGRSATFRRRFLGTHFFNPPRYLKLLEIIPSEATDREVVARMAHFGRIHLGKGIVVARDTPYFIGNRVGVYGMLQTMRAFTDGDYSIEEVDALTGPLVGRPRSATFRTADLVGLDVMLDVAENLYEAVPDDESRAAFRPPDVLRRLVDAGRLGQKSGAGFYRKEGKEIKSVDLDTFEYTSGDAQGLTELPTIETAGGLEERLRALLEADGRAGDFFRKTMLDLCAYSSRRIPEIAISPADIDRAIRWGFGWELGPFETWDALGFESVRDAVTDRGIEVPDWILEMKKHGRYAFYRRENGRHEVYVPAQTGYEVDLRPRDEVSLDAIRQDADRELWSSSSATLLRLSDDVALYEFRSKANTLGREVMDGLNEAIDRVESDRSLRGLVIANDGKNFSVGANLAEVAAALQRGSFDSIEEYLRSFQRTIQRIHYARKPVIVAVHQRVLGGACEMVMACPNPVASAESYIGLVELGVGLIPAGTGCMRLAASASEGAPAGHASEIQARLRPFFDTVAMATVSTSAREAQQLGFLPPHARVVMNDDRRIDVAREEVLRLSIEGYFPPPSRNHITVLGRPGRAAFQVAVQQVLEGRFITEYDAYLANRLAFVLTGGDLTAPQPVPEEYLLHLERQVFLELLRDKRTQDRIEYMLKTKKPLRN